MMKILLLLLLLVGCKTTRQEVLIVPEPYKMVVSEGEFNLSNEIEIVVSEQNDDLERVASYYVDMMSIEGVNSKLVVSDISKEKTINLIINPNLDSLTKEGYILDVTPAKIDISSSSAAGVFRAISTLEQLITEQKSVGAINIVDKPRFEWRGVMLDISRHFQPVDSIKHFIDMLSYHKMNKLHLHLTDGIGWRLEIEKYPKLTEQGAYRKVTPHSRSWENFELYNGSGDLNDATQWYGGYLTKNDVKELVQYASDRFVEIIPEIEMPGHSVAVLACYPEYACPNAEGNVDVFCAGNDETFKFLSDIIDETVELFPSKYIHVGGDEVGKGQWLNCPRCKKRMANEGLESGEELQSYFMKRMEAHIASKGKQLIGWDEIIEGGLPKSATVMSWTGLQNGIKAANAGHDVIMSPIGHCYFDHYQGNNNFEPQAWGGYTSVEKTYSFDPIPEEISSDKQHHILGGQANLWTESIATMDHIEYMLYPRLTALSEVLWSPRETRDWDKFKKKIDLHFDIYSQKGYKYAESSLTPISTSKLLSDNNLEVTFETELGGYPIYYTLDGSEPTMSSNLYTEPFIIEDISTLKAQTFRKNKKVGYLQSYEMLKNKATGAKVTYENPYSPAYSGRGDSTLVDNIYAIKRGDSKDWQGVEKEDFIVTIDMHKEQQISNIVLSYFQHLSTTSVVLPYEVELYSSLDGEEFTLIEKIEDFKDVNRDGLVKKIDVKKDTFSSRYIKVISKNIGILPKGYTREGQNAWVFMDEVSIN